jgi:hypothetical protein
MTTRYSTVRRAAGTSQSSRPRGTGNLITPLSRSTVDTTDTRIRQDRRVRRTKVYAAATAPHASTAISATLPSNTAAASAMTAQRSPIGNTTVRLSQYTAEPLSASTRSDSCPSRPPRWWGMTTTALSCRRPYQVSVMCRTVCSTIAATASFQAPVAAASPA